MSDRRRGPAADAPREAAWGAVEWTWLALAVAGLTGFALITWLVAGRVALPFDGPLRDAALTWSGWRLAWQALSEAANIPLIVIGAGTVGWLFWKRRRREAVLVLITLALVTAGSEGVKQLVARPRPPGSDTVVPGVIYSFPSGHELEAITILGIDALLLWRSRQPLPLRLGFAIAVAVFCGLVAVARVAIDAHYPSDVLAGVLGGVGVLALFAILTRRSAGERRSRLGAADPPRSGTGASDPAPTADGGVASSAIAARPRWSEEAVETTAVTPPES